MVTGAHPEGTLMLTRTWELAKVPPLVLFSDRRVPSTAERSASDVVEDDPR